MVCDDRLRCWRVDGESAEANAGKEVDGREKKNEESAADTGDGCFSLAGFWLLAFCPLLLRLLGPLQGRVGTLRRAVQAGPLPIPTIASLAIGLMRPRVRLNAALGKAWPAKNSIIHSIIYFCVFFFLLPSFFLSHFFLSLLFALSLSSLRRQ